MDVVMPQESFSAGISEVDIRNIVEACTDALLIIDGEGRVQFANPASELLFARSAEELLNTPVGFPVIAGEKAEVDVVARDGVRVAEMLAANLLWRGKPAILAMLRDITAYKLAQKEIQTANAILEQKIRERTASLAEANRELEAFAYSASHDLIAPLRHIHGFTTLLHEHLPESDAETERLIGLILASIERMQALINSLLRFSKLGRAGLSMGKVALQKVVEDSIRELSGGLGNRSVEWRIGPLPEVNADPALLQLVFVNLLSNALKFTRPCERPSIGIDCCQTVHGSTFRVSDNGVGFDMAHAHKLFGVFERLHTSNGFEGTGIGLATVRRIVEKHGGRVWAESAPGEGATFYFTLVGPANRPAGE